MLKMKKLKLVTIYITLILWAIIGCTNSSSAEVEDNTINKDSLCIFKDAVIDGDDWIVTFYTCLKGDPKFEGPDWGLGKIDMKDDPNSEGHFFSFRVSMEKDYSFRLFYSSGDLVTSEESEGTFLYDPRTNKLIFTVKVNGSRLETYNGVLVANLLGGINKDSLCLFNSVVKIGDYYKVTLYTALRGNPKVQGPRELWASDPRIMQDDPQTGGHFFSFNVFIDGGDYSFRVYKSSGALLSNAEMKAISQGNHNLYDPRPNKMIFTVKVNGNILATYDGKFIAYLT